MGMQDQVGHMIIIFKMAAIRLSLVWFLSLIICHFSLASSFHVPVFMWSKDSSLSPDKPLLAGHTVTAQDFQEKYLRSVLQKTQTVSLFIQDKLSIDDLTHYGDVYSTGSHGNAFSNLKFAIQQANSSVVLPSVDIAPTGVMTNLVEYIKKNVKGQVIIVEEDELKSFKAENYLLDDKVTNVFVIHLHPIEISSTSNAGLAFEQNDKVIDMVTKEIEKLGTSYTCILTAKTPNKDVSNQMLAVDISLLPHDRLRRDVAFDSKASSGILVWYKNHTLFANGKCVFVYMKGFRLRHFNLTVDFFNMSGGGVSGLVTHTCSNFSAEKIDMSLSIHEFGNLDLRGEFNRTYSDWKCISFTAKINGKVGDVSLVENLVFPCTKIQVPLGMSYSCYNTTFTSGNYSLQFLNFQVQPYIKNGKFSYSYDCVGFFSIPILMGLFTTGILLLILFFGIMAVFSITTMDRFDDPKGSSRSFGSTAG